MLCTTHEKLKFKHSIIQQKNVMASDAQRLMCHVIPLEGLPSPRTKVVR